MTNATQEPTVDVQGNLYKLDALVTAYSEILEQAKAQLEAYEPDEAQLDSLAQRTADKLSRPAMAKCVISALAADEYSLESIANLVARRLDDQLIRGLIRDELTSVVKQRFEDLSIDIETRFRNLISAEQRHARQQERDIQYSLERLVSAVMPTLSPAIRAGVAEHLNSAQDNNS